MGGTLTLKSSKIIPVECAMISRPEDQSPPVNKVKEERIKVAINPEHPEQTVMIGSNLTEKTRSKFATTSRSIDKIQLGPVHCVPKKGGMTVVKNDENDLIPTRLVLGNTSQKVKMSEAEPIPPTSSVTALRIPMIKKGEYDLWSMKMRQYIAITDHILWDIITNGDQATTDPASSSAPKTSLAANARRNNEKALNILLSAIPDRHLLSLKQQYGQP
ncbi:hypothetical protein Tco_0757221 [Tanacetum coccineum]